MPVSGRIKALMAGEEPTPPPDGSTIDFAPYSLVGGPANPLGVDATYIRWGDEVTALGTLGAAFEAPLGRAHGGVVSTIVDETMTALLTVLETVAFTSFLQVEYVGPTPLHVPLEFRARLTGRTECNLTLTCTGQAGDTFVRATGNSIEVDLRHLLADMDHLVGD